MLALRFPGPPGDAAARDLLASWRDGYTVMLVEMARFVQPEVRPRLLATLGAATGRSFTDLDGWYRWIWGTAPTPHPEYGRFKSLLYALIDPSFAEYFEGRSSVIRLEEVRWGGVRRDGIPPLREPKTESAAEAASWLADEHVVFGVAFNGEARAYPKRILAWHEMVADEVGGVPFHGVYCTLCGAMIVYRSQVDGVRYSLGTSGFLYRSNKLMYDQTTRSLWSTMDGRPVVGPLVGRGIELEPLPVVTTTWGAWRARHPGTRVLSLETGFDRDYGEGVAYRDYFASDALMFAVPELDPALPNKAEVLALRFGADARPRAYASAWLREQGLVAGELGGVPYLIVSDASGAHRVYRREGELRLEGEALRDPEGGEWLAGEDGLHGPHDRVWPRLPAHRAFWFGWRAAFPETELIGAGD